MNGVVGAVCKRALKQIQNEALLRLCFFLCLKLLTKLCPQGVNRGDAKCVRYKRIGEFRQLLLLNIQQGGFDFICFKRTAFI